MEKREAKENNVNKYLVKENIVSNTKSVDGYLLIADKLCWVSCGFYHSLGAESCLIID